MSRLRPNLRIATLLVFAGISLTAAAACSKLGLGGSSPTAPSGPPKAGSTVNYSAIGASDADGYGSSVPCFADCSNGTGYVFVTERALRSQNLTVNLTLLAVPTATIGPDFEALGNQYNHFVLANEIDDALFVTEDASLVTVFAGGNDVEVVMSALGGGAGASNQTAYIDSQIAAFGTDYSTLLADVHSRAGSPRIVVMNLPNFAGIPMHANDPLINREALQRLSVGMTTSVINKLTSQGVLVVDLMCNSQFYDPSIYSSDGFHPNDTGYALMSSLIVQAVNSTSYPNPPASCSQMTLVP